MTNTTYFAADQRRRVLRSWRHWSHDTPDGVTTACRLVCLPSHHDVPAELRGAAVVAVEAHDTDPARLRSLEAQLYASATSMFRGSDVMLGAPQVGNPMVIQRLDDWAIETLARVTGSASPLAFELRHIAGPASAGSWRRAPNARFRLTAHAVPGVTASPAQLEQRYARVVAALGPWTVAKPPKARGRGSKATTGIEPV